MTTGRPDDRLLEASAPSDRSSNTNVNYLHELSIASLAAREAGQIARLMQAGIQATDKADGSPVTPGDLAADQLIRHLLGLHFPEDGILSEEAVDDAARLARSRVWIIDPIDGTKDYAAGGAGWAVQIALVVEGALVLGVLDLPVYGVQLTGIPGQGATIRNADGVLPLRYENRLLTTLIASSSARNAQALVAIREVLPEYGITTCTSVGVKVHRMLQGEADLYVHTRPIYEWDVAAPAAVLIAAGGTATALGGTELAFNTPGGRCPGLVFSTRPDHPAIVDRLQVAGLRAG
jgi:3'-phosphoadenosine 5'-phosphosulfate (PAPS) 3'-phosphatase